MNGEKYTKDVTAITTPFSGVEKKGKEDENEKKYDTNLNSFTIGLLLFAGLLFLFAIFAPLLFTFPASSERLDFTETGQIGDTIGGLMSPFINLSGVIVPIKRIAGLQTLRPSFPKNINVSCLLVWTTTN